MVFERTVASPMPASKMRSAGGRGLTCASSCATRSEIRHFSSVVLTNVRYFRRLSKNLNGFASFQSTLLQSTRIPFEHRSIPDSPQHTNRLARTTMSLRPAHNRPHSERSSCHEPFPCHVLLSQYCLQQKHTPALWRQGGTVGSKTSISGLQGSRKRLSGMLIPVDEKTISMAVEGMVPREFEPDNYDIIIRNSSRVRKRMAKPWEPASSSRPARPQRTGTWS